jgi:hypothetical protein
MKIASLTLLLESGRELCSVPPSPASIESATASTSSLKLSHIMQSKRAPAKSPPFQLDGKQQADILLKFPAVRE